MAERGTSKFLRRFVIPRVVAATASSLPAASDEKPHMRDFTRIAVLGLGLSVTGPVIIPASAEDGPPRLDIEKTCKSSAGAEVRLNETASVDSCLRSERGAESDLKREWSTFPDAAKKQCASQFQAGGYPSYVETLTCLELASGIAPAQTGDKAAAKRQREGGSLVTEPSPNQRTDPIEVLNDKDGK